MIFNLLISLAISQTPNSDKVVDFNDVDYKYNWYSGYLNSTSQKAIHYVFFEAIKPGPLILWLNGGPGCSSLIGMTMQNGPFIFPNGSDKLTLNPYAWNNNANLLYLQTPYGVGFSYGDDLSTDDDKNAKDNLQALLLFFQKYSQYKANEFYIIGESYAGVYVPYLALKIIQYNKQPGTAQINLKGIMVGNGCTTYQQCYLPGDADFSIYQYQFLHNHFYIEQYGDNKLGQSESCKSYKSLISQQFAVTNSSIYNLYSPCYFSPTDNNTNKKFFGTKSLDCLDTFAMTNFFNNQQLYSKIHVRNPSEGFTPCTDKITYLKLPQSSYWIYKQLLNQIRIYIYSGDVDACVPITGTRSWITSFREQMDIPILRSWRQWWVKGLTPQQDQVGGMTWELEGLTFVSIKGAGHMVPKDKPVQAEVLLNSFISGQSMPQK